MSPLSLPLISLLLVFLYSVSCQVVGHGKCPPVTLQKNFNPEKFFRGKYYELARFPTTFEADTICSTAEYEVTGPNQIAIYNSAVSLKTGERFYANGTGFCDTHEPASCFARISRAGPIGIYKVLSSDSENYACVYSCQQVKEDTFEEYAFILSRTRVATLVETMSYKAVFFKNKIDPSNFQATRQHCIN